MQAHTCELTPRVCMFPTSSLLRNSVMCNSYMDFLDFTSTPHSDPFLPLTSQWQCTATESCDHTQEFNTVSCTLIIDYVTALTVHQIAICSNFHFDQARYHLVFQGRCGNRSLTVSPAENKTSTVDTGTDGAHTCTCRPSHHKRSITVAKSIVHPEFGAQLGPEECTPWRCPMSTWGSQLL